jgi:flagellar basal-body rod modification protein FlgD
MANSFDVDSARLASLGLTLREPAQKDRQALGQEEFFDLLVTQLRFQDPTKPLDNDQMFTQVAQISSVDGLGEIQSSLKELVTSMQSTQALQASTLVGSDVLIPGVDFELVQGERTVAAAELQSSAANLTIGVFDQAGQLVRRLELGPRSAGLAKFEFDGLDESGSPLPGGRYELRAEADIGNRVEALSTFVKAHVDSVSLNQGGGIATLNLSGLGSVDITSVRELL